MSCPFKPVQCPSSASPSGPVVQAGRQHYENNTEGVRRLNAIRASCGADPAAIPPFRLNVLKREELSPPILFFCTRPTSRRWAMAARRSLGVLARVWRDFVSSPVAPSSSMGKCLCASAPAGSADALPSDGTLSKSGHRPPHTGGRHGSAADMYDHSYPSISAPMRWSVEPSWPTRLGAHRQCFAGTVSRPAAHCRHAAARRLIETIRASSSSTPVCRRRCIGAGRLPLARRTTDQVDTVAASCPRSPRPS